MPPIIEYILLVYSVCFSVVDSLFASVSVGDLFGLLWVVCHSCSVALDELPHGVSCVLSQFVFSHNYVKCVSPPPSANFPD